MRIVENELATVEKASAYQVDDLLIVRVAGTKPTACHIVTIERALTDVEPPAFVIRLTTDPRARCMDVVAQYDHVQAFRIGGAREQVLVHHAGGELTVDVEQVTVDGGSRLGRGVAGETQAQTPGAGTILGDPFGEPFGEPSEAYGYSRSYDLAEAVKDAISKLPPRGATIPDWLSSYSVVSLDVEIGGIAGFNHLRVTVRG